MSKKKSINKLAFNLKALDKAILHAEEVANNNCNECGREHRQLAKWLKELKNYKETGHDLELKYSFDARINNLAVTSIIKKFSSEHFAQAVADCINTALNDAVKNYLIDKNEVENYKQRFINRLMKEL